MTATPMQAAQYLLENYSGGELYQHLLDDRASSGGAQPWQSLAPSQPRTGSGGIIFAYLDLAEDRWYVTDSGRAAIRLCRSMLGLFPHQGRSLTIFELLAPLDESNLRVAAEALAMLCGVEEVRT